MNPATTSCWGAVASPAVPRFPWAITAPLFMVMLAIDVVLVLRSREVQEVLVVLGTVLPRTACSCVAAVRPAR